MQQSKPNVRIKGLNLNPICLISLLCGIIVLLIGGIQILLIMVLGIKPDNIEALDQVEIFISSIEKNQSEIAFKVVAKNVQSAINNKSFINNINCDFQKIVELFRAVNITIRSEDEFTYYVSNLGGRRGVLRFVMIQEDENWKIANIMQEDLPN